MPLHPIVHEVTERIRARSQDTRSAYIARIEDARSRPDRGERLSCGNLAHGFAAAPLGDKLRLKGEAAVNLGIVTSYNDMLSAHQPFAGYPDLIKDAARALGATAQVAGGVPAMCDGVTQGRPGMELSLFSRDVIAMATGVALTHDMFDAAVCLGTCDKIVPGLMIGALAFGHMPILFAPAGPMPSGIPNKEKASVRERFARGEASRAELLDAEAASYHTAGTCTFYGTANSNQMLMEIMGVHLPGAAFVNPGTALRDALTRASAQRAIALARAKSAPLGHVIDARAIVNGIVGLHATGGSTNHLLHLPAIARAAGIVITWDDFDALSRVTPLLARIYPNGGADVNQFHAAGGLGFVIRELMDAGLLHEDVATNAEGGVRAYAREPFLQDGILAWRDAPLRSLDETILRGAADPFASEGGLKMMRGDLGRAVMKVSAVAPEHRVVEAPAMVFHDQDDFLQAFKAGALDRDVVAVVRFQGPKANGMPELHKLTPSLTALQNKGRKVALVTDGRMSGASGQVPAAIHVTPEAHEGGPIARVRDGDIIRVDGETGRISVRADDFAARAPATFTQPQFGYGRELFRAFRTAVGDSETGATQFW
ncbi:MAG: phosphogluconate dehydratase [Alphaproteobacteria bacterium]|nr:phosphogluconate dehydratase [Alphaproteobacteria bacterium]